MSDDRHILVRNFEGRDMAALLACWREALPYDAVSEDVFLRKVLLDGNYEPASVQVAELDGRVAGFVNCFVLNRPIEKVGHREDTGYIQAMGVSPWAQGRGVGRALLAAAEEFMTTRGRKTVVLAPYTPNYFVPGVDKDRYAAGLAFLRHHGFEEYTEAVAADACIATFEMPAEALEAEENLGREGIVIRPFEPEDTAGFLEFLRRDMPGPWIEDARRNLVEMTHGRFRADAIWLAIRDGVIIGYCIHEHEHFGPFGVAEGYQGKGIGTVLLARTLLTMRINGCHSAWVLWTGDRALNGVYGRLGFRETRRFAILRKTLA